MHVSVCFAPTNDRGSCTIPTMFSEKVFHAPAFFRASRPFFSPELRVVSFAGSVRVVRARATGFFFASRFSREVFDAIVDGFFLCGDFAVVTNEVCCFFEVCLVQDIVFNDLYVFL